MITVQAEILFRVETQADADRILTAVANVVMVEMDGSMVAKTAPGAVVWPDEPWQHPHMEGR